MKRENVIKQLKRMKMDKSHTGDEYNAICEAIKTLEQEPCEMTAEEYRQRMIQAFHNADTDELIAVCVSPTENEFEFLEWLLKNHYKQGPCEDAISRQAVIDGINEYFHNEYYQRTSIQDCRDCLIEDVIKNMPSVTPQPKTVHWIEDEDEMKVWCSECGEENDRCSNCCPNCGAKMVEPQESEGQE